MSTFLRTVLMNSSEACDWLQDTHLKGQSPPPFMSFMLEGNDDAPTRVALFRDHKPAYNAKAIANYAQDMLGNMVLQEPVIEAKHSARASVVFLELPEKDITIADLIRDDGGVKCMMGEL